MWDHISFLRPILILSKGGLLVIEMEPVVTNSQKLNERRLTDIIEVTGKNETSISHSFPFEQEGLQERASSILFLDCSAD